MDAALTVLQAVADPIRWTVLSVLAAGPRCVCSLQGDVPIAGNLLSYHLKVLREAGLITSSRRGRWVDYAVADRWGHLMVPDPLSVMDALLAATALIHDWTLVTRNIRDFERTGVRLLNPFSA